MLRGFWTLLVFVVITGGFAAAAMVTSIVRPGSDACFRIGKIWARILLRVSGTRVTSDGAESVPWNRPCVFISNHQSIVDIWALFPLLPDHTRFVAKRSLFFIPVFGWALALGGFIPIDRGNRTRAMRSLELAAERIRGGRSVLMFAEGTRSRDGRLLPFKRGAFHLALRAGVPVVPIAVSGSGAVLPAGTMRVVSGPVRVAFAPPVDLAPYLPSDTDGLSARVRSEILNLLSPADGTDAGGDTPEAWSTGSGAEGRTQR